ERFKKITAELEQTEAELDTAVETNQDDLAMVLIQKKNALMTEHAELTAEAESARSDADSAKSSLMNVQSEIKKLQAERDTMQAKKQLEELKAKKAAQQQGQQKTM